MVIASALWFILRPLRVPFPERQIARLIEEKSALADRLSTTVECTEQPGTASPAIVARLVEDTAARMIVAFDVEQVRIGAVGVWLQAVLSKHREHQVPNRSGVRVGGSARILDERHVRQGLP